MFRSSSVLTLQVVMLEIWSALCLFCEQRNLPFIVIRPKRAVSETTFWGRYIYTENVPRFWIQFLLNREQHHNCSRNVIPKPIWSSNPSKSELLLSKYVTPLANFRVSIGISLFLSQLWPHGVVKRLTVLQIEYGAHFNVNYLIDLFIFSVQEDVLLEPPNLHLHCNHKSLKSTLFDTWKIRY